MFEQVQALSLRSSLSEPLGGAGPLFLKGTQRRQAALQSQTANAGWSSHNFRPGFQRSRRRRRAALYGRALVAVLCGRGYGCRCAQRRPRSVPPAPEAPLVIQRARMESVDGWPMATIFHKTFGGKLQPASPTLRRRCAGGTHPPPEACKSQLRELSSLTTRGRTSLFLQLEVEVPFPTRLSSSRSCGGPRFGEHSGGNWMARRAPRQALSRADAGDPKAGRP